MTRRPDRVTFTGSRGTPLAGRLDLPAGPPRAFALFAHCFTCSKDIVAAGRIAAELNAHGIGVLRFDFTGLGSSGGDFANTDFSSNLADLRLAAAWLRENHTAPQLLIGHSLGGAAAIAVAAEIEEVRAVATIGAPADVAHITRLFGAQLPEIESEGRAVVEIAGRSFTIRRELLEDLTKHSVEIRAAELGAALLVIHSPIDNTVGIDNAARIYAAARHPKSFIAVDGGNHLLTNPTDAVYVGRMIASWSERFLVDENPAELAPKASAPVVVAETGQGTFLNHVVVGDHRFLADEPVDIGGYDAGPSPYDLLGAALGACTSMTLRLYADRKKLALDRVTVEVTHAKTHAKDLDACIEGAGPLIDHFERRITVTGELDDDQRSALLRIADKCPVHRTLESSARTSTSLAEHTNARS
jgi:uncharacterized OsmC-like protein/alpha/beta superfamily hydrolase